MASLLFNRPKTNHGADGRRDERAKSSRVPEGDAESQLSSLW
jgi:hypothetical protein